MAFFLFFSLYVGIEKKNSIQRVAHMAYYDALTDLPNRENIIKQLQFELAHAKRRGKSFSILFIDLDNFKNVNDTLGHNIGDALLQAVARLLGKTLRAEDMLARMGGDEYVALLRDIGSPHDTAIVAQKILENVRQPIVIQGNEIFVTASIGVAVFPSDGDEPLTLLKNADAAMYYAKNSGRNAYRFFTAEMNARAQERMRLENALRHVLQREELVLYYQPEVEARTGKIDSMEALIRWFPVGSESVSPARLVAVAEEAGLIVEIGEWILRAACRQMKTWQQQGIAPRRVAVNISRRQLVQERFPELVRAILGETGVTPDSIELEITESTLMEESGAITAMLDGLQKLGVQISMDDFGTGYSSMSCLQQLPLDRLKIDKSFIDRLASSNGKAVAKGIIALAHNLELEVVAEGVETKEQAEFLQQNNCDLLQGFYFSRPLPPNEVLQLLQSRVQSLSTALPHNTL